MDNTVEKLIETCALKDYGVVLNVSETDFIKGISYFTCRFGEITFKYTSTHLNINSIVRDLIELIKKMNIPTFKMKIQESDVLRLKTFDVFTEKFGHCTWAIGSTWYSPYNDLYELEVILQGKKLNYTHQGPIDSSEHRDIGKFYMDSYPEYII